jgi:hypothetical protein
MIARVASFVIGMSLALAGLTRGATWDTSLDPVSPPLANATLGVTSRNAAITPDGVVHLVYQNNLASDRSQLMYLSRSPSGTWSIPVSISPDTVSARNASVIVDHEGRVHVIFELAEGTTEDIAHLIRDANGAWSSPVFVSPSPGLSRSPVTCVDSFDKLHVVWVDGRNSIQRILHATWTSDTGWRGPDVLSSGGPSPQDPTIDSDQLGGIHIFWSDRVISTPDQVWDLFYTRLDAASSTVPPPKDLVHATSVAVHPYVEALDDGTVYLVWLDSRAASHNDAFEVYYKRFLPGVGWGKDKRFTYDGTNHARPVIVSGAGHSLNVVWEDFRFGSPDIFYRQITPETGWDRDVTPLTTDESASQSPTLVSEPNGGLLLIWSGAQEGGTFRIFVREGSAVSAP